MALAFDTATNGTKTDSGTSVSTAMTLGASADILIAGIIGSANGGADDFTSVTFNGVAMTLGAKRAASTAVNRYIYAYYLINPGTGSSYNLVANRTTSDFIYLCGASYSGAKATGQPDATATADSNSATASFASSVTSVSDGCWRITIAGGYDGNNAPAAGSGLTRRGYDTVYGTGGIFDSGGPVSPAGAYSGTTTYPGSSNSIGHVNLMIVPAAFGGGAAPDGEVVILFL